MDDAPFHEFLEDALAGIQSHVGEIVADLTDRTQDGPAAPAEPALGDPLSERAPPGAG